MTAKKAYFILIGVLILACIAACATLYFGNSLMQKSANKLVKTKLANISDSTEEQNYMLARKDLKKYSSLNAIILQILPKNKDQAQAVSQLYQIANETGITISQIQFPPSSLGLTSATTGSTTTTTSSSGVTQAVAVAGIPGVLGITVNVTLEPLSGKTISFNDMINFLQDVEANRRSMEINQVSVQSDTENGGITFSATLTIFVKP
jgi:Tfp pilus assembly protein PilO